VLVLLLVLEQELVLVPSGAGVVSGAAGVGVCCQGSWRWCFLEKLTSAIHQTGSLVLPFDPVVLFGVVGRRRDSLGSSMFLLGVVNNPYELTNE
jgi:hypothetical protein